METTNFIDFSLPPTGSSPKDYRLLHMNKRISPMEGGKGPEERLARDSPRCIRQAKILAFIRAAGHNGLPPTLCARRVRTGAEEQLAVGLTLYSYPGFWAMSQKIVGENRRVVSLLESRFAPKPEPCVMMRGKVAPVRCRVRSSEKGGGRLLLRVDVVAQVLESDAGEMLRAAGKNHCHGGEERGYLSLWEGELKCNNLTSGRLISHEAVVHHFSCGVALQGSGATLCDVGALYYTSACPSLTSALGFRTKVHVHQSYRAPAVTLARLQRMTADGGGASKLEDVSRGPASRRAGSQVCILSWT
ncbi:hypothetical protein INR49_013511 [Caranx melampygus]|nr:hypothetical protein INR49_013511 [Caranx melampygus]